MKVEQKVLQLLPLLGPVPIAWTVYDAATTHLAWPGLVAGAAAVFIEGIGFSSINLAVRMDQFNKRLWKTEKKKFTAPTLYAVSGALLYSGTALLLAVLLEIVPTLRAWAPASFILMSVTSGFVYALYGDQERRESDHSFSRAKRKERRSATVSDAASDAQRQSATLQRRSSDSQRRSASGSATLSDAPAKIYRCTCGEEYTNRYEYSGHTGKCVDYQSKKRGKLIPAQLPKSQKLAESRSTTTTTKESSELNDSVVVAERTKSDADVAACLAACRKAGIGNPQAHRISELEHVTPELIAAHVADLQPGETRGLAIVRIENDEQPASWMRAKSDESASYKDIESWHA